MAVSTSGGITRFRINAQPRSIVNAIPTTDAISNSPITGPPARINSTIVLNDQYLKNSIVVKRETNLSIIRSQQPLQIRRKRRIRRRVQNRALASPRQRVRHLVLGHLQTHDAAVLV